MSLQTLLKAAATAVALGVAAPALAAPRAAAPAVVGVPVASVDTVGRQLWLK